MESAWCVAIGAIGQSGWMDSRTGEGGGGGHGKEMRGSVKREHRQQQEKASTAVVEVE